MEVLVVFHDSKKLVNRGFLVGPLIPIYGCGSVLIILLLSKYKDEIMVLFVMAIFICTILEYFTSYIMEKMFKLRWWDYSDKKFHINGRVCLDNSFAFGILSVLLVRFVNPFIINILSNISSIVLYIITGIIFVLFIVDMVVSFKIINGFSKVAKSVNKDSTAEITKKVREILLQKGGLYERLVKAFNFEASEKLLKDVATRVTNTVNKAKDAAKETLEKSKKTYQETRKNIEEDYKKTINKLNMQKKEAKKLMDKRIKNLKK